MSRALYLTKSDVGVLHESDLLIQTWQRDLKVPKNVAIQVRLAPTPTVGKGSKLLILPP